jgi:hypothetical protein
MALHEWLAGWAEWGWALLANHLWQATLFSVAFLLLLLRRGPSRTRYTIWVIAGLRLPYPRRCWHSWRRWASICHGTARKRARETPTPSLGLQCPFPIEQYCPARRVRRA